MLTNDQKFMLAEFVADYNGGDAEDYIDEIDATRDDFSHYENADGWNEWAGRTVDEEYEVPAIYYESVQAVKGQTRSALWVMDFGDVRGIYQF